MYMAVKHIHLTLIAVSVLFFITRYVWVMTNSGMMQKKWVKIAPHVIDSMLLVSALVLCVIISQYPFMTGWLTEKFIGLVLYIGFGLLALKLGKDKKVKTVGFIFAVATIAFMGKLAVTKQALLF